MKKITLLLSALAFGLVVQAQVSVTGSSLTYTQNFNTLANTGTTNAMTLPGWSIFRLGGTAANQITFVASDGTSNTGGAHSVGAAASTERALGSLGSGSATPIYYGAKFANNTGVAITSMHVTYKQEQWRVGDTTGTNVDSTQFYYSLNASDVNDTSATAVWTEVSPLMMTSLVTRATSTNGNGINGDSLFAVKDATINLASASGANIVIRWKDLNSAGSDDLNAVDSLTIVFGTNVAPPANYRPVATAYTPANGATGVALNTNLTIAFDRQIAKGAGNIRVTNQTDHTAPQVIPAAATTVAGNIVTIPGVTLLNAKTYYVQFDSTAFDTAGYKSYGLYDSTSWKFTTINAPVGTVTSLSESFDASCPTGLPAGWQAISVAGPIATWKCNTTGPNYNLTINGGSVGSSEGNEDWLITPKLAATAGMKLYFKSRYNFAGPNMEVLYSSNYSGSGAPSAASWTSLVSPYAAADSNKWVTKSASLAAGNIYIAFKYISNANTTVSEGRRWDVDSVFTNTTTGINTVNSRNNTLGVQVLGNATNGHVMIGFDLENTATVKAAIYDLAGREVFAGVYNAVKGSNTLNLQPQTLQSGMYIIRISNGKEQGIARTFIQ